MAHQAGRKEKGRARILTGAGRGFRSHGYGGLGVDGIAREAGVTSGAFYAHFKSKAGAFREAVAEGLSGLRAGVDGMRDTHGAEWRPKFVDFYLGDRRTCDLADSCALQSLTGEVARADDDVRRTYEVELQRVIAAMTDRVDGGQNDARADDDNFALLALLIGGVSMARAVKDPLLGDKIILAVRAAAHKIERTA